MMFDNTDNEKPSVMESYAVAAGSSNLRVGNDSNIRTPGDLVAAAGMSKHDFGLLLQRLQSEWECAKKPRPQSIKQIEALAATFKRLPGSRLTRYKVRLDGKEVERDVMPIVAAQWEADRWYANEMMLLFLRLKSLPAVRRRLTAQASAQGLDGGIHLVAAILQWWLDQKCPVCEGRKKRVIAGTGRTGSKACSKCAGTGERKLPHGWQGRRMLGYINECMSAAKKELAEGRQSRRSENGNKAREEEAARQEQAKIRRRDAADKDDLLQDAEALRAVFRLPS